MREVGKKLGNLGRIWTDLSELYADLQRSVGLAAAIISAEINLPYFAQRHGLLPVL